jgi:hypothetical protein
MAPGSPLFVALLVGHLVAFLLAFAGYLAERFHRRWRLAHFAYHIIRGNIAGLQAYGDLLRRRNFLKWEKPSR